MGSREGDRHKGFKVGVAGPISQRKRLSGREEQGLLSPHSLGPVPPDLNLLPCHQVVTSRDSQETLLVIAFVFEVSTSEHGAQHHVYKLVKD